MAEQKGVAPAANGTTADLSAATGQLDILAELDAPRQSLLDVVRQKAESLGLLEKIHKIIIVCKYGKVSDNGDALKDILENIIRAEEAADEQAGVLTGLLLMFPVCCLLLLEGPQRLVTGTLKKIKEQRERSAELVTSIHMLISIQDAPGRFFPLFASRTLQASKADPVLLEKEQILNLIPDISINLQKFGRKLDQMSVEEQNRALESLQRLHAEHLPRLEDLLGLCASPDVLTLDEYLDLYYTPTLCLGGPLDSEVVWPLPPPIKY